MTKDVCRIQCENSELGSKISQQKWLFHYVSLSVDKWLISSHKDLSANMLAPLIPLRLCIIDES